MKTLRHTIAPEEDGRMVKQIARGAMGASHRLFSQVKFAGGVLLEGERALANARVRAGQELELRLAEEAAPEADATHSAGAYTVNSRMGSSSTLPPRRSPSRKAMGVATMKSSGCVWIR